jgi:hypothetical protein
MEDWREKRRSSPSTHSSHFAIVTATISPWPLLMICGAQALAIQASLLIPFSKDRSDFLTLIISDLGNHFLLFTSLGLPSPVDVIPCIDFSPLQETLMMSFFFGYIPINI